MSEVSKAVIELMIGNKISFDWDVIEMMEKDIVRAFEKSNEKGE